MVFVNQVSSVVIPLRVWMIEIASGQDAMNMINLGLDHFNVDPNNATLLTNNPAYEDAAQGPATREQILANLDQMVSSAQPGDNLVFFFSGHGTQTLDTSGAPETDGMDEAIVTSDGQRITDDELNSYLEQLPAGCRFTLISDSCHSGTLGDVNQNPNIQAEVVSITAAPDDGVSTLLSVVGLGKHAPLTHISILNI